MKRFMVLAALLLASSGLAAFGEHSGDVRLRFDNYDTATMDDSMTTLRARLWTGGTVGEGVSFHLASLFGFEFGEGSDGEESGVYNAYLTWDTGVGPVHAGRLPGSFASNDFVVDSLPHDGGTGFFEGAAVSLPSYGSVSSDVYVVATSEDTDGFGVTAHLDELLGFSSHIGYVSLEAGGGDFDGLYAGGSIDVGGFDIAISFISGDSGLEDGSALSATVTYPFDEILISGEVAHVDAGAISPFGGLGDSVAVDDGTYRRLGVEWNDWSIAWIDWSDSLSSDNELFRLQYEVGIG